MRCIGLAYPDLRSPLDLVAFGKEFPDGADGAA
jgi:hypothetical protein